MFTIRYNDNGTPKSHDVTTRNLATAKMWAKELSRDFHGTAMVVEHTQQVGEETIQAVYDRGIALW